MTATNQQIPIEQIFCDETENIRHNYGKLDELILSIKENNGNIQPIGVIKENGKFKVKYGFRRFRALKLAEIKEANCLIYDSVDEKEQFNLMYGENSGRKNLSWYEDALALEKKLKFEVDKKSEAKDKQAKKLEKSARSINRILESARIVGEFEVLREEKTRSAAARKFKLLKTLDQTIQDKLKNNEITLKKALTLVKKTEQRKNIDSGKLVIEELKAEVAHYKEKSSKITEEIKDLDKEKRLEAGIWLEAEVSLLIDGARTCEAFGKKDIEKRECIKCEKSTPNIKARCDFWHERNK